MPIYNLPSQSHPPFTAVRSESCTPSVPGSPKTDFPPPNWHMNMSRCQVLSLRYPGMGVVRLGWCPRKGSWRIPSPSGLWYREPHRNSTFVKDLKAPSLAAFVELILTDPTGHLPKAKTTPWGTTAPYKRTRISLSLGCLCMGVLVLGLNRDSGLQGYPGTQ